MPLEADVAVIGGGVIGHAIAWEALRTGRSVILVDSEPGAGASWAAAGMLAPVSELHYQEEDLLELMLESSALWPEFAAAFPASGQEPGESASGYLTTTTLAIGADAGDRQALADLRTVQLAHGLTVEPLTVREARSREPLLSPGISCAFDIPTDHQVDPRRLLAAMAAAFPETEREASAGGRDARAAVAVPGRTIREKATGLLWDEDRVAGVRLSSGRTLRARETVVANGLGAAGLEGLPDGLNLPLRPVYGDIIRLRVPAHLQPLLGSTVRGLVHGVPVYIVPREDGTVVIGATQREDALGISGPPSRPGIKGEAGTPGSASSSGNAVSAGGVYQLLRDAQVLVPAVAELELLECTARARPGTPDNAPLLGRAAKPADSSDIDGLIIATGFFRHGILLAPVAAAICLQLMDGPADPRWAPFRPDRFSGNAREPAQGVPPQTAQHVDAEPHSPVRKQHEYHA